MHDNLKVFVCSKKKIWFCKVFYFNFIFKINSNENFANAEKLFRHWAFIQMIKLLPLISARLNGNILLNTCEFLTFL